MPSPKSIKIGLDIGKYEGILKESGWLKRLMMLLNGGDSIEATEVRTIALLVNRGITAWLGQRSEKSPATKLLALTAREYVMKLEEWEAKE